MARRIWGDEWVRQSLDGEGGGGGADVVGLPGRACCDVADDVAVDAWCKRAAHEPGGGALPVGAGIRPDGTRPGRADAAIPGAFKDCGRLCVVLKLDFDVVGL
mmetsp:Transcript_23735/g.65856  ORF Transcript_23735/g.65856 Transcript_23735/m.65856 type:complete len:103 (+) Transcript_23735:292-600(+)